MGKANYFPLNDGIESLTGEVIFATPDWTHLMVDGTDTVAVLPTEDVYPA